MWTTWTAREHALQNWCKEERKAALSAPETAPRVRTALAAANHIGVRDLRRVIRLANCSQKLPYLAAVVSGSDFGHAEMAVWIR